MTRALALATAATFVFASPGFAQSTPAPAPSSAPPAAEKRLDLSARAAGIDDMAAARMRSAQPRAVRPQAAPATQPEAERRSFWKTPWPYVIIAGVAVGVLIAAGDGDGFY